MENMTKWRRVWRCGLAPVLGLAGLVALRQALAFDDPRLIQGRIANPTPTDARRDGAVLGACSIGYCGWRGEGLGSVGEVEDFFHRICAEADAACAEEAACRYFLNWFDATPRAEMRRLLLAEVNLALSQCALAAA